MLNNEAPNVVSEDGFRLLLDEGYQAVVVCHSEVEKQGTQWTGRWTLWAVGSEEGSNRLLVSARGHLKPREFKTTLGLIGFIRKMGFEAAVIPFREGARAVQNQERNKAAPTTE